MLAHSFLIESSSKLLVTSTGIKAWSRSILGRIRPLILQLLALEWRKFHTFELEYLWSQLANLDQILCVASLGWGKGCIRWPDWPWHIGLRWAIIALWATCFVLFYNINNYLKDIKWYYNKFKWVKFKYFDTVSESGFRRDTSSAFFGTSIWLHVYSWTR